MFRWILPWFFFWAVSAAADPPADQRLRELNLPPEGNSVYDLNLLADSSLIVAGAAVVIGTNSLSYSFINQRCPCDPNEINFIDRPVILNDNKTLDIIANYSVSLAMLAPVVIDYLDVGFGRAYVEDMVVYADVLAINFTLVTISKFSTQRPYPYVYQKSKLGFETDPSDYLSFYSGHTSSTFSALTAASVTLNLRHRKALWPWIVTGVVGTSVGLELILSGEHFTSDVLVGALMGLGVGSIVPGLHAKDPHWFQHIVFLPQPGQAEVVWVADF